MEKLNPNILVYRDIKNGLNFVKALTENYFKINAVGRNETLRLVLKSIDEAIHTICVAILEDAQRDGVTSSSVPKLDV